MLVTFMMRYFDLIAEGSLKSTIIIAGYILAVFFNALMAIGCLFLLMKRKNANIFQPWWVFIFNFLCFIFQIYLIIR